MHVNKRFSSLLSNKGFGKTCHWFMVTPDSLFLLPIADTKLVIITQLIYAVNVIAPAAQ
jgi:hypothetical protein